MKGEERNKKFNLTWLSKWESERERERRSKFNGVRKQNCTKSPSATTTVVAAFAKEVRFANQSESKTDRSWHNKSKSKSRQTNKQKGRQLGGGCHRRRRRLIVIVVVLVDWSIEDTFSVFSHCLLTETTSQVQTWQLKAKMCRAQTNNAT